MKRTLNRLEKIESRLYSTKSAKKSAIIIYNPENPFTLPSEYIGAEHLIILPDNGTDPTLNCREGFKIS
jgi:hypothetical protein